MIAAAAATLAVPAAASANQNGPESFKDFTVGAGVGGQFGWSADDKLDQRIIDVDGHHKLRMSNAVTTQSFDDLPFSRRSIRLVKRSRTTTCSRTNSRSSRRLVSASLASR